MKTNIPVTKAYDGWVRVETPEGPILIRDIQNPTPPHLRGVERKSAVASMQQAHDYNSQFDWLERMLLDQRTHKSFDNQTEVNTHE